VWRESREKEVGLGAMDLGWREALETAARTRKAERAGAAG